MPSGQNAPAPRPTATGRGNATLLIALIVGGVPAVLVLGRNASCSRPPPVAVPTPAGFATAPHPSAPPVELELETATGRVDITSDTVNLPSGDVVTLAPRPIWSFFGESVGFEYPSDARVTVELAEDGAPEIIAGNPGGVTVRITPLRADEDPDVVFPAFLDAMLARGLTRTGATRTLVVRGRPLEGTVLEQPATGMRVELFVQRDAPRAIVAVYRPGLASGDELATRILGSLRAERGEPLPEFDVLYGEARAPLAIEVPTTVTAGGTTLALTLRRRATVRRTLAGVVFEHDARFAASETHDGLTDRVQLTYGGVGIQVIVAAGIGPDELRASLASTLATASTPVAITHGAGARALEGTRFVLAFGGDQITTDVYARNFGGRTAALLVQYQASAAERANAAVDTIAASLR